MGLNIKAENLNVQRVIFEMDDKRLVFDHPTVIATSMAGQKVFQIMGEYREEYAINEEDVSLLMEKTGKSREEVIRALKESKGDLAEALTKLTAQ